jgi:hypothetical protein
MCYLECSYWSNNYAQSKTLETFEIFNQMYLHMYFAPSDEPYSWQRN